jgi:hypothetical protein
VNEKNSEVHNVEVSDGVVESRRKGPRSGHQ